LLYLRLHFLTRTPPPLVVTCTPIFKCKQTMSLIAGHYWLPWQANARHSLLYKGIKAALQPPFTYQLIASLVCHSQTGKVPSCGLDQMYWCKRRGCFIFFFQSDLWVLTQRIKTHVMSKMGSFSSGIVFIGLPTISVSAEAERIDLHLTLPGCELKGGKKYYQLLQILSFHFFQGCRAKIIWL